MKKLIGNRRFYERVLYITIPIMIQNGITNFEGLSFSKDSVKEAIDRCGFDASVRGEKLSLEDFARLADELA